MVLHNILLKHCSQFRNKAFYSIWRCVGALIFELAMDPYVKLRVLIT